MAPKRRTKRAKRRAVGPERNNWRRSSQVWAVSTALAAVVLGGVWMFRSGQTTQASPGVAPSSASVATPQAQPVVRSLRVDVLREFSHERDAYTQGLVWWNDSLFESTGLERQSTLRRLDVQTGRVEQRLDLEAQYFGEGLALVDRRLVMLTLRAERAFTFDRASFEFGATYKYQGAGWGLCYDGARLVMSDGSDRLTFRDPETFEPVGEVRVRLRGQPLHKLNELECVDGILGMGGRVVQLHPTGFAQGLGDKDHHGRAVTRLAIAIYGEAIAVEFGPSVVPVVAEGVPERNRRYEKGQENGQGMSHGHGRCSCAKSFLPLGVSR